MSQQLIASALSRTTAATLQFGKSSILPHPAVPLKSAMSFQNQCNRYITLHSTLDPAAKYSQRIYNNVSRLYARRMIELASFSAATMASTTQMESRFMIEKPKEWQTVDLVEQRKQFGESISSLGKTKLSRVWAAGKFGMFIVAYTMYNCSSG
jgi:hypothetical protein